MKHFLSLLAFVIITFATQATSHMLINADYYEALGFFRAEPIFLLGFVAMLIQGAIMTCCLHFLTPEGATIRLGLIVSLGFGLFLTSYISFASPAKYAVPSIWEWIAVELSVSTIQFIAFGIALGFIHSRFKAKTRSKLKQAL